VVPTQSEKVLRHPVDSGKAFPTCFSNRKWDILFMTHFKGKRRPQLEARGFFSPTSKSVVEFF